jgi:hypothetical protein
VCHGLFLVGPPCAQVQGGLFALTCIIRKVEVLLPLMPRPTKQEMFAKAKATRLKNLRNRLVKGPPLTEMDKKILQTLEKELGQQ